MENWQITQGNIVMKLLMLNAKSTWFASKILKFEKLFHLFKLANVTIKGQFGLL